MSTQALRVQVGKILREHYSGSPDTHREVARKIVDLYYERGEGYAIERWGPKDEPQQNS